MEIKFRIYIFFLISKERMFERIEKINKQIKELAI